MKYEAEDATKSHLWQILEDKKKHEIEQHTRDKIRMKTMKDLLKKEYKKSTLDDIKTNHCCYLSKSTGTGCYTNGNKGGCNITKDAIRV